MRDLLDVRQELQAYQAVLGRLRRETAQNDDIVSSPELFTLALADHVLPRRPTS